MKKAGASIIDEVLRQKLGRVALMHDFLLYPGGAEKVLSELMEMFPDAPVYTLLCDREKMADVIHGRDVRTSFLDRWPRFLTRRHRWLLPFYAPAVESLDLRQYDTVISSSGAWSKGLVTRLNTRHISYQHSTMRFIWDENEKYMRTATASLRFPVRQFLSYIRVWDLQAAQRPEVLIANSQYTRGRIQKYYRRASEVIYPGVQMPTWSSLKALKAGDSQDDKPFVIVSRLSDYKNVALAIDVCNKLQLPLTIIGDGPQKKELIKRAGPTVTLLGWLDEDHKWKVLSGARAFLFPCEDDFGITCVEALAAGTPVIALGRGGAREIISGDDVGVLFDVPTVEVMADGVRRFLLRESEFDPEALRSHAERYHRDVFEHAFVDALEKAL